MASVIATPLVSGGRWWQASRNSYTTAGQQPVHADCQTERNRTRPQMPKIMMDPMPQSRGARRPEAGPVTTGDRRPARRRGRLGLGAPGRGAGRSPWAGEPRHELLLCLRPPQVRADPSRRPARLQAHPSPTGENCSPTDIACGSPGHDAAAVRPTARHTPRSTPAPLRTLCVTRPSSARWTAYAPAWAWSHLVGNVSQAPLHVPVDDTACLLARGGRAGNRSSSRSRSRS